MFILKYSYSFEIQYYIDHFAVNCNLVSCNSIQYFTIGHRNYHLVNYYFSCNCNYNSFLMVIHSISQLMSFCLVKFQLQNGLNQTKSRSIII